MAFLAPAALPGPVPPRRARCAARGPPSALARAARRTRSTPASGPAPVPEAAGGARGRAVAAFFEELGVSAAESARAAGRCPALLGEADLSARARPLLELLSSLGLSGRQTARALRHAPGAVLRDARECAARVAFLRSAARFPRPRVPAAVARCPHLLWMDLARARAVLAMLAAACPALAPDALGAVLARAPQALVRDPRRLRRNLRFLQGPAGLAEPAALARVLGRVPLALVYEVPSNLAPRVRYFAEEVGLAPPGVGAVLAANPDALMWGLDSVIRPKVAAIASVVGPDGVARVLEKVPTLLAAEGLMDRVMWLRDVVGLDEGQVRAVVREAPAVLGYSIEGNLGPKWSFVHGTMGGTAEDVVQAPREILCANLQQRAVPRYAFLASSGIEDVPVVRVLQGCDVEFCKTVAKCDPAEYRKYVDNDTYLLFFSQLL